MTTEQGADAAEINDVWSEEDLRDLAAFSAQNADDQFKTTFRTTILNSGGAMLSKLTELTFDIQLQPGEALSLPKDAGEIVGPGHWVVSIRPAEGASDPNITRDHSAFLNSYAPEDEGLYDDYSAG